MNKSDAIKKANEREKLINGLDTSLESLVKKYQAKLLSSVSEVIDELVTDEEDRLINNTANTSTIGKLDKALDRGDAAAKEAVINSLVNGFSGIVSFNGAYFQEIEPNDIKPVSMSVLDAVKNWLGITKNNDLRKNDYLDTLVKSSVLKNEIKQRTVSAIVSGQGWQQTKKNLSEFIQGNKERLGAMQRYYRNFTYDVFAQVDRKAGEDFSNKLGYQFAIYAGGLIETSRAFCREHNSNVYHISEIQKFKPKEAIPPNYDPIADLGGYGCRHSLNWIPDSLAVRLRPDAAKFIKEDEQPQPGKQEAPKKAAPKKQEPKADPVPKEQAPPAATVTQYVDTSAKYRGYTHTQARKRIADVIPMAKSVSIGSKVPKENIPGILSAIDYLANKYIYAATSIPKIKFTGGSGYYGRVSRYTISGDIAEIDLGASSDPGKDRLRTDVLSDNLKRGKSAVDKENSHLATVVHEWAHVIATENSKKLSSLLTGKSIDEFFVKLYGIRKEYNEELINFRNDGKNDEAGAIFLGRYANVNNNEFMAEAFTEYQLNSTPSKYAIKVGKLIDEYFLK